MKPKCETNHCRKRKVKGRKYCHSCIKKAYKEKHPVRYSYNSLKQNAKRRQKDFSLTFEEFEQFCYKTDYIRGAGKMSHSYSIDRIDSTKGYHIDNIQVLTLSQNSSKGRKVLLYDYQYPEHVTVVQTYNPNQRQESLETDIF